MPTQSKSIAAIAYLVALLRMNLKASLAQPVTSLIAAVMMFGNNLILFLIWVIYFARFSNIRGWVLQDLSLLLGVVAWGFGLTMLVAGGVRDLARTIVDGGLDVHLGRPRHPLPSLLISRSIPSGIGDMASAFLFWLWLGQRSLGELPLLILVSTASAAVLCATLTITQCLVLWFPRAITLCEDLFNMLLMVAFYPQHPYGFTVRLVLFTVFPTAFISLVPVQAVRDRSGIAVMAMIFASAAYAFIALWIFNRGMRRYTSGNRVVELR